MKYYFTPHETRVGRSGRRLLSALGLTRDQVTAVTGEIHWHAGWSGEQGALEWDDLWATALLTVWQTRQANPFARGGLLRLRVRWALRDLLRREQRAHGIVRSHRATVTTADAASWARCPCGQPVAARQADYCPACIRVRRRLQWHAYRERRKAAA